MNYQKLAPDGTFIRAYMDMMEPLETPYAYDFWCACFCLSSAIGRRIHVPRPMAPVYLNMYAILASQSGITRKSTAVRYAAGLIRSVLAETAPHTELVETGIGKEQLYIQLAEQTKQRSTAEACIVVSELATFLGKEVYNLALPAMLTDLYDCPEQRQSAGTAASGRRDLSNVCINFLSASTPAWLMRAINPDVIEGGFTSRCLFVVAEEGKRRIVWPEKRQDEQARFSNLQNCLVSIATRTETVRSDHGGINISEAALARLGSWYRSRGIHQDPYRSSFESREDHHVIRIAALLSINEDGWIIQPNHISKAIKLINHCKEEGAGLFSGALTSSRLAIGVDRLRQELIACGRDGATQTQLVVAVRAYLKAHQLATLLEIMHELGLIQKFELAGDTGRPTTIWRATKAIAKRGVIDATMRRLEELP